MERTLSNDDLYFVVLPVIRMGGPNIGLTEQILTLMPGEDLATLFFPDEVERYLLFFKNRMGHLTGGHVKGYDFFEEPTEDGRVRVRVIQSVG